MIALSRLSHTDVLPLLNSLVNYCISRAHDHNIAGQEAQQIVNVAEVEDPKGGGRVFGVCFCPQGFTPFYKRWGTEALLELVTSGFTIVYSVSRDCICNL